MTDDGTRSRFDGRGRVGFRGEEPIKARAEAVAHALGHQLVPVGRSRAAPPALGCRRSVTAEGSRPAAG